MVKITKPYREELGLDLWQPQSYYFSFTQLHMISHSKTSWQNETKARDIVLMLHDCMTINMTLVVDGCYRK